MPTDLLGRDYETFPAPEPLQTHGPARVIAMCNQKGGVGKTTSSINIGGALSQYGRRVLIVDFDPQGAATVGLGINANAVEDTVYTALFNPRMDVHSVIHHTDFENLDIMPANIDLSAAEVQLVTEVGREQVLAGVLRQVKDEEEIAAIRKAQSITDAAFLEILDFIKPGKTEKEVAAYLEYCMRRLGADGLAFETIAAGGPNSAKPHAVPGDRPLRQGDFFTMDYGAYWGGYCSDMTRTVAVGEPTEEMRRVYDTVLAAQLLGIEKAVVGASCRAVDAAARELIYNAGYEGCFGHSLGHSVGIEIHEMPGFSPSIAPETTAKEGMVITVEPGIYLEGRFGVRIEDMVWLAPDGTKDLTNSPKELIIL